MIVRKNKSKLDYSKGQILNDYWTVYVIETDKHIKNFWNQISVYVGMSRYSPEVRLLQHLDGNRAYLKRHGKPIRLIEKFTVTGIQNEVLANDIERLVWFKLLNSKVYKPVQKYAPSLQGRTEYLDNYPNYEA